MIERAIKLANQVVDIFNNHYLGCIDPECHVSACVDKRVKETEINRYRTALEFYADRQRWRKLPVIATGTELASRYNEAKGESEAVPVKPGQHLGYRWVPSPSTQVDRGQKARLALDPDTKEEE